MKAVAAGLLLTCALWAEPPSIVVLQPRGTQKGRPFSLTVVGQNLGEGLSVISNLPAAFTPLGDAKDGMANRTATFLVEPKAEWAVGVYTIRLKGSNGLSNVLLFSVGAFPEIAEDESRPGASPHQNDSIERDRLPRRQRVSRVRHAQADVSMVPEAVNSLVCITSPLWQQRDRGPRRSRVRRGDEADG